MTDVLFAALATNPPRLVSYTIGPEGLDPAPVAAPLPGAPADLAISPDARLLYADVAIGKTHHALSFRIDGTTGGLTPIGPPAYVGPYPCYLSVDRSGRWLLAAYYSDGMVTVHAIGADGVVGAEVQRLETVRFAHCVLTDPANRYAFVPHVREENAIWQLRFDARTGQLSPNDPLKAVPAPGHGPRHLCFHPNGRFAFSNGEQDSRVTAWAYEAASGRLTLRQSAPGLPAGWTGDSACSQIHITPDGRFLYSCNRGHDSLAGFAVDGDTGGLTPLGQVPAEPTPDACAISPDGRWLFSAGRTPVLVVYRLDPGRGALERAAELATGPVPWLLAARVG